MARTYCEERGWREGADEEARWKSCAAKFHSIMVIPLTARWVQARISWGIHGLLKFC
jgi:hypothetical protein